MHYKRYTRRNRSMLVELSLRSNAPQNKTTVPERARLGAPVGPCCTTWNFHGGHAHSPDLLVL